MQTDMPKDNAYLNFAFNVKTQYEMPVESMERIETQEVIEGFLEKRAKRHISENYS